jgi:hypothetical protein
MDLREVVETPVWGLYEKGRNYHRQMGVYVDTDRNYRMYNGDQWAGAKLDGVEPVQQNFIKPIVKYKVSVIHSNLYAINYSSQNFENREFQQQSGNYCTMLNRYAARVWEKDKMDFKGRRITKDAAINDEGIIYVNFDEETKMPVNEIVKKNDIYYGNENDDEIQNQPYILIRKRLPVINAVELAESLGMNKDNIFVMENGEILKVNKFRALKEDATVEADAILVDGLGVGDVGNIVLRDRKLLSESGLIIVVAAIEKESQMVVSGPDIISRGFVYVRENEMLMEEARKVAIEALEKCSKKKMKDWNSMKGQVRDALNAYIYETTKRSPIILPIFLEV